MLFFVVQLSRYCEFKAEYAFPNQSFSRPSFNHHHVLPGAFFTTYFNTASVAIGRRFNTASKKKITLRE